MPTCCAINCSYKHCRKKDFGKSVHKFPFSRPNILKQWIIKIRRKNWTPTKSSLICSDHFEENCFDRSGQIIRLKPDAVPTIFNFPSHLGDKEKKQLISRRLTKNISIQRSKKAEESAVQRVLPRLIAIQDKSPREISVQDSLPTQKITAQVPVAKVPSTAPLVHDHNYVTFTFPVNIRRAFQDKLVECEVLKTRLSISDRCIQRLRSKVNSLKEVINGLKDQSPNSAKSEEMVERSKSGTSSDLLEQLDPS